MVGCVCFLFNSCGLRRYEASATVQRVFAGVGPAYVFVSCSCPYLTSGGDTELWRRVVRCCVIDDAASVQFFNIVFVRKRAVREGEDTNRTILGLCLHCYVVCRPPARKRLGTQCRSLLHLSVKTDTAASSVQGPACLPFLWAAERGTARAYLPPAERDKVCPACKTAAECRSRVARRPPTPLSVSVGGVSIPPVVSAVIKQCRLPGMAAAPDAGCVEQLMHAHLQRTRPEKICTVFSNGRIRTYQRIPTSVKSVVGLRHARRRRAMAAGVVSPIMQTDPSTVTAAMETIQRRSRAREGVTVAPWQSLSVREQLQFKVSNRISGVTWGRFRVLLAGGGKSLASLHALRTEAAAAFGEARHAVTTNDQGAFLVSPRAAVQARLDDLVASGEFLESPIQEHESHTECDGSAWDVPPWGTDSSDSGDEDVSLADDAPPPQPERDTPLGRDDEGVAPCGPSTADWSGLDALGSAALLSAVPAGPLSATVEPPPAAATSTELPTGDHHGHPACPDDTSTADDPAGDGGGASEAPDDCGGTTASPSQCGSPADGTAAAAPAVVDSTRSAVQLCFGMNKGGRTSTVQTFLGIANQRHPASEGHSIVLGLFPCKTDNHTALKTICGVWLADIEEVRANGVQVRAPCESS